MLEQQESWARSRVREAYSVFEDIISEAEGGKISWGEALEQMVAEFDGKMPTFEEKEG